MGLSNQQIERYARQIIVPGIGGIAQERLLAARLMLAGKATDLAPVLSYMVGAGIGEIRLRLPRSDHAEQELMVTRAAQLNPEVIVKPGSDDLAGLDLIIAIGGGSEASLPITSEIIRVNSPLIFVRLDEPARIGVFPEHPPCPLCADADLTAPEKPRVDNAGFVTMIAATEAFKLLACSAQLSAPSLLEFRGFACSIRDLRREHVESTCSCSPYTKD